jgi:2-polyprenyl-3-methyl-5-hydroxy-6-metoxy-1,4-benzoquinol methylase
VNEKSWFETWFSSPYYTALYNGRDDGEARRFIPRLLGYLQPPAGAKFLDTPCGTGRHTGCLSSAGFAVTGIDLSNEFIMTARTRVKNAKFYRHDMRRIFRPNEYDFALNLFTSFGYFSDEENTVALRAMSAELRQDGVIVIDFLNTYYVIRNLVSHEVRIVSGVTFDIHRSVQRGVIIKDIDVRNGQSLHFSEHVRALYLEDFTQYCEASDLEVVNVFGDYDLNEYQPEHSERMIVVAKKTAR